MLEHLLSVAKYRINSYPYMNDRLIYIDFVDRNYTYDVRTVDPVDGYRFQGNLLGLFSAMGVPDKLLPYAMYLNGYTNPVQYDGARLTFKIPKMPPIPDQ